MNKYCSECGNKLNIGDKFCGECGSKINHITENKNNNQIDSFLSTYFGTLINSYPKEKTKVINDKSNKESILFCPNCGQILNNATICPDCGELATTQKIINNANFDNFMNDYATTIVLWTYNKPKKLPKGNNDVPAYYSYECNIIDIDRFMQNIIQQGLIRRPNYAELLEVLKVSDLKDILKSNNLTQTGKKEDLIERIVSNKVTTNLIDEINDYYVISEKGTSFFEENKEYIKIHKNQKYQISPKEYYNIRKVKPKSKGYSYSDCIWGIFQKRLLNYQRNHEYFNLYYNYQNMLDIAYSEKKYNVAINLCIKCILFELLGIHVYNQWDFYKKYKDDYLKKNLFESIQNYNYINGNNFKELVNMKNYYTIDILTEEYENIEFELKLCSLKVIEKIIDDLLNNPQFNIDNYLPIIKKEYEININKYL